MNLKSFFSIVASLSFVSQVALASIGTESGGGGDPDAVEFLSKVRAIAEWSQTSGSPFGYEDMQRIVSVSQILSQKMDLGSQTPIVMVDENLVDASGASKVALYDMRDFKIKVTRNKWRNLPEDQKFVTASLELFGLSGVQGRYVTASLVKKDIQNVKEYSTVQSGDMYIQWWKTYGKKDYGVYQGTDSKNRLCRVSLEQGPSSYQADETIRDVNVEFADLDFRIGFDVSNGQGKMPLTAHVYRYNEQNKKVWMTAADHNASTFFEGHFKIHKTLKAAAALDLRGSRKLTITSKDQTYECAHLQKLSNAGVLKLLMPKIEAMFKQALKERAQEKCQYNCPEQAAIWNEMSTLLAKTRQRLSSGDGVGATESLIRFTTSIYFATESELSYSPRTLNQLRGHMLDNIFLLVHLEN